MIDEIVDVTSVEVITGTVVRLGFSDGKSKMIDLRPLMIGPVYDEVFDGGFFDQVAVDPEGGTIAWPNGADLSPDVLRWGTSGVHASSEIASQVEDAFEEMLRAQFPIWRSHYEARGSFHYLKPTGSAIHKVRLPHDVSVGLTGRSYKIFVAGGAIGHFSALGDDAREARAST